MDEDNAKAALAASMKIAPEQLDVVLAKLKEVLRTSNTVRDVRTPRIDNRIYYHIRVGQFETVVDGRDCDSSDNALEYATKNRTQAWYFVDDGNDEPVPLTTKWTHKQFVDWLRR